MLAEQSDATECAPKKKQKAAAPAAAKKNKAGPALSAIEAALHLEDGEYNMEKIVADRLVGGKKEYLVKWEGYASGHRYSVCDCTPTMDQHHSTAVTARALCLPALKQLYGAPGKTRFNFFYTPPPCAADVAHTSGAQSMEK